MVLVELPVEKPSDADEAVAATPVGVLVVEPVAVSLAKRADWDETLQRY